MINWYEFERIIDQLVNEINNEPQLVTHWVDNSVRFLADKKAKYGNSNYVEQLEKNCIYLSETAFFCTVTMAKFMCDEYPGSHMNLDQISAYSATTIEKAARESAASIFNYIHHLPADNKYHNRHINYMGIKYLYNHGDPSEYLEMLEFYTIYSQFSNLVTQTMLIQVLGNPLLSGRFRTPQYSSDSFLNDLITSLIDRLTLRIALLIGWYKNELMAKEPNGVLMGPLSPNIKRPKWRELWGAQFDNIQIQGKKKTVYVHCKNCGKRLSKKDKFCRHCGIEVN